MAPLPLSANVKNSFAYKTLKDRLPVILTKVIDTVCRRRHEACAAYGEGGAEDIKAIIAVLSELRYRLATDKPLLPLDGNSSAIWNHWLNKIKQNQELTWFNAPWLLAECYLYRKISEQFEKSRFFKECDPFQYQKEQAFIGHLSQMDVIAESMLCHSIQLISSVDALRTTLSNFFELSLWANRFDLSISAGEHSQKNPLEDLQALNRFVLVNDLNKLLSLLIDKRVVSRVDIVLDNAGFELFSDLCLAELLLRLNLVSAVHFHAKALPWFVSDVTFRDCLWTLELLRASERKNLSALGHEWHNKLESGQFVFKSHDFWTFPHPYSEMATVSPDLYQELSESTLLIFKGDLHYRKLTGDLQREHTVPFADALGGFLPTNLVVLRTLKAELVVGLQPGQAEQAEKQNSDWLTSGEYAVIQLALKN